MLVLSGVWPGASALWAGTCSHIKTKDRVGLRNALVEVAFDASTGALLSLKNLTSNDEYLKDPGGSGNPFRVYLNARELPAIVTATFPWRVALLNDTNNLGGQLVEPSGCQLVQSDFCHTNGVGILRLTSQHALAKLWFESEFRLPDNADAVECCLVVRNAGDKVQSVITAFP
jgi:hypothetical protein